MFLSDIQISICLVSNYLLNHNNYIIFNKSSLKNFKTIKTKTTLNITMIGFTILKDSTILIDSLSCSEGEHFYRNIFIDFIPLYEGFLRWVSENKESFKMGHNLTRKLA